MASNAQKKRIYKNVPVVDLGLKGRNIAKQNGFVFLVNNTVPGDEVDIKITRKKKSFFEGRPVFFHKYSEHRTEPFCSHFGTCGGCKLQNMDYQAQLFFKQKKVENALSRIGKIALPAISPIIPAVETRYYRNRLDFGFSNLRWLTNEETASSETVFDRNGLGFHIPGRYDKVLNIEHCHLQPEPSNAIRLAVRDFATAQEMEFYDVVAKKGFLRSLIVKTAETSEVMVILVVNERQEENQQKLSDFIRIKFPKVTSLYLVVNNKLNDTLYDQEHELIWGNPYLTEEISGLKFRLGPKSFFQTNTRQAQVLYQKALDMAALQPAEIVYDLYCGVGSISLFMAQKAKHVIGIETVTEAVEDAKRNAALNDISNVEFVAGTVEDLLKPEFVAKYAAPDVLMIDPPRSGMHPTAVKAIAELLPPRIVYISCNPDTQARDIAPLAELYEVIQVQPVDMFPHTDHIENIVLLKRK
ncbi:MAG: 23S rRNA (uracil(1939)-C(5))-methyltransferase RlmD [Bacteroidia bacterium]